MNERINAVLKKVFDLSDDEIAGNRTRQEIAKWDSLTHMDLIVNLEKEFDVRLSIDDIIAMDSLDTIRAIMTKIESN